MNKRKILASLSKIANNLDLMGRNEEADKITGVMNRISNIFDDDFNDMVRDMDPEEMSDYSFSGEDYDFRDDGDDFPTDDDDIIRGFDTDRTPGRSEMFENDMPGEIPNLRQDLFEIAIDREVERRLPEASDQERDQLKEDIRSTIIQMIKDARL